jgi:hypothetical protein
VVMWQAKSLGCMAGAKKLEGLGLGGGDLVSTVVMSILRVPCFVCMDCAKTCLILGPVCDECDVWGIFLSNTKTCFSKQKKKMWQAKKRW